MRAKWRSPRRDGSSVLRKALDTPNIVRDGRITPNAPVSAGRLLASRGGGGWNEQTWQREIPRGPNQSSAFLNWITANRRSWTAFVHPRADELTLVPGTSGQGQIGQVLRQNSPPQQDCVPIGQRVHSPATQLGTLLRQVPPHAPQLKGSDAVSTQLPEQRVRPGAQAGGGTERDVSRKTPRP
jgi:hypothetical protein